MFFKTMTFQGMIELLIVITPAYTMALSFYTENKYSGQIATAAIMICSLQAWLNYICVIYNVAPYRKAITNWFRSFNSNNKGSCADVSTQVVVSIVPTR